MSKHEPLKLLAEDEDDLAASERPAVGRDERTEEMRVLEGRGP